MAALVIYQILVWRQKILDKSSQASRHLFWSVFFLGLGLANHYSVILVVPGVFFIILITKRGVLLKKALQMALIFLLGLLPYLQIIYSSRQPHHPAYGNLPSLSRFLAYIWRADYGGPISAGAIISPPQAAPDTFYYFKLFSQQFTPLALLVILIGFWLVYKKSLWDKLVVYLLYFFSGLFVFWRYLRQIDPNDLHVLGVAERFSLLSFVPFALCLGVSLALILDLIKKRSPRLALLLNSQRIGWLIIFGLIGWQIFRTLPLVNKNNYYLAHNYGLNILNQVEENAIIFSTDDLTNSSLDYFIQVENIKPEVILISSAFLSNQAYQQEIKQTWPDLYTTDSHYEYDIIKDIIKANQTRRPIYFVMLDDPYPLGFNGNPHRFWPKGILLLAKTDLNMSSVQEEVTTKDWWATYNLDGLDKSYPEPFARLTANSYAFRHRINATVYMEHLDLYSFAKKEAEASLALNPKSKQAQAILEKLNSEYKDYADDFRPKTDIDYGKPAEEHYQEAERLAQTPSIIKNFNLHRAVYESQLAVGKDPQHEMAHGLLGTLYEYFNCWPEAAQAYIKALKLNPDNPEWNERLNILKYNRVI
jgi:hypothetical protein